MPKAALLEGWRDAVSDGFSFALKAPRRITHVQRLKGSNESLGFLFAATSVLGGKLGPVLFQLPPFLRKDAPLLSDFLALLPPTLRAAFEFRHPSWFDDEVFALLTSHNAALCGGDAERGDRSPPHVATANFGYLRLRAPSYDAAELRTWSERILGERWTDAYVYLKHEVLGPEYALFLGAVAAGEAEPAFPELASSPLPPVKAQARPKKGLVRTKPSKPAAEAAEARTRTSSRRAAK